MPIADSFPMAIVYTQGWFSAARVDTRLPRCRACALSARRCRTGVDRGSELSRYGGLVPRRMTARPLAQARRGEAPDWRLEEVCAVLDSLAVRGLVEKLLGGRVQLMAERRRVVRDLRDVN